MPVRSYRDGFESGTLDGEVWTCQQILRRQVSFSADAPEMRKALQVTLKTGDEGEECETPCQRAEIRQHGKLRPLYGETFWHSFSFKVNGDIPTAGHLHTVVGQWKAPFDVSPFLAQRLDDGVFQISVQDGPHRRIVASAKGDQRRLDEFQAQIAQLHADPTFGPSGIRTAATLAYLKQLVDQTSVPPAPDYDPAVRGRIAEAEQAMSSLRGESFQRLLAEFSFVHELDAYFQPANVRVVRPNNAPLPDPRKGWVRMAYGIVCGRLDNLYGPVKEGEVEIHANGQLIATVRGNLGYRWTKPISDWSHYCKFGIYRAKTPGTVSFLFDDFRQGRSYADVT